MNWMNILKAGQIQVLEQSETEAQEYWDFHIGLSLGLSSPFKNNIKRETNIARSGLVDEFKVFTWIDSQTKLPLMSRTVGFSHDRYEGKQVVYFAGSIGLQYLLNSWENQGPYRKVFDPKNPEADEHGWVDREQTPGEVRVSGAQVQGKSKEKSNEEHRWKKDMLKPIRGKQYKDIPEEEKYRLEALRAAGFYHSPERIDIGTIADKHSGKQSATGSYSANLNRVSPLYRRTQNYLLDKYKGNWIVTVLINPQLREYFQTSKGGNFRQANFFTRSRSKHLVPRTIREIIRKVLGLKSAPWYIHTPTNIDTSMAGHDFGMESLKAETVQPDDEDDETPGANFRQMPTIRETGALRDSEIVNVKDEDHCCTVMRKRIKESMTPNAGPPIVYKKGKRWQVNAGGATHDEKLLLIDLFIAADTGTCDEMMALLENGSGNIEAYVEARGDNVPAVSDGWATMKRNIKRHTRRYVNTGDQEIDIDQLLKDWEECSSMVQDKFEPHDTEFTASTKVDRWFGLIKEGGAVSFGGHGQGNQADLFNVKYGDNCGCGMEECECQKKK